MYQDNLIDVSLLATDELYMMVEPLLGATPKSLMLHKSDNMLNLYIAMVMRNLKTIEEVPIRYRDDVMSTLSQIK